MDFIILQSAAYCPNMKRRAGEAGEGPSNKVIFLIFWLKTSLGIQVVREERGWERRAGMILEVKLRNFMCHEASHCLFLIHTEFFPSRPCHKTLFLIPPQKVVPNRISLLLPFQVQVYNFQPNQRLNFLCGENGSGKSAVD